MLNADALRKNLAARREDIRLGQQQQKPQRANGAGPKSSPDPADKVPHAPEAEKAVLSILLQHPDTIPQTSRLLMPWHMHVPAHREVYQVMVDAHDSGARIGLIELTQILSDQGRLLTVGGASFITELQTMVAVPESLEWFIGIVHEKAILRELIRTGTNMVRAAYGLKDSAELVGVIDDFSRRFESIKRTASGRNGSVSQEMEHLMTMNTRDDQHSLVGNNYLVRGGNCLWAGGAGYGKSSLVMQLALYWATGTTVFGLKPIRKLKSLIVQAENDEYDMADQVQGVIKGINSIGDLDVSECRDLVLKNVIVYRVEAKSGPAFVAELEDLVGMVKPDLAWIDPLFAYAGCDLMNAEKTGRFLREYLFPVATKHLCCLNVVHHIGKPVRDKNQIELSNNEKQYLGFGTSEIQNAFRAVNSLLPVKNTAEDGRRIFGLTFSKRGIRAGAKSPDGAFTDHIFLEYGKDGICWMQCERPEEIESPGAKNAQKYGEADVLEHMSVSKGWKTAELAKHTRQESGMTSATFYRIWKTLKENQKIRVDQDGLWFRKGLSKASLS